MGDDVREAVGHRWWLLTVDHDRIDELLRASPANDQETRQKQEVIKELRSTYEVELVRDERNTREFTYHLVNSDVSPVHEKEFSQDIQQESNNGGDTVDRVAESASAALEQEAESTVRPAHDGDIHEKMAVTTIEGTEHSASDSVIKEAATDPNQWDQKCKVCSNDWLYLGDRFDLVNISPDTVENEVRKQIRDIDDSAVALSLA